MDKFPYKSENSVYNGGNPPTHLRIIQELLRNKSNISDEFGIDLSNDEDYDETARFLRNAVSQPLQAQNNENLEDTISFTFQVVLLTVIGVFGCIGNASIVIRFAKIKKQLTFHRLMMMLSVSDTFVIILSFFIFALPDLSQDYHDSILAHIAPIIFPSAKIALTASIYSTLAIALERYVIICHPFYAINHRWPAKKYIIFILIFSIIYNLPRFFSIKTVICPDETLESGWQEQNASNFNIRTVSNCTPGEAQLRPTLLRLDYYYYSVYLFWMDLCVMEVLPMVCLIMLNMFVLKSFRRKLNNRLRSNSIAVGIFNTTAATLLVDRRISNSKHNRRKNNLTIEHVELGLAKLSLTIVFIFILCHSFKLIPNIHELLFGLSHEGELESSWVRSIIHLSNFLIVLCCSSNFYVYCFTHLNIGTKIKEWINIFYCYMSSAGTKQQQNSSFALTSVTCVDKVQTDNTIDNTL